MDCSLSKGLPVLTQCASTSSSVSLSLSKREKDTGTQLENKSPCSNSWIFGLWLGLLGVLYASSDF